MGLLDIFNTYEGQQGLGLLAAAGPRSDGAGFGQRLQEGLGAADLWKRKKAADEFQQMQVEAYKAKALQEKQAMEAAMAKKAALPTLFTPSSAGAPMLSVDSLLPPEFRAGTMPQAAIAPRRGGIDVQKALANNYTPDEIFKLDSLRNVGMDEVARVEKFMQNGREVAQQLDKYGRPVGQGLEQYRAPIEMNTNDQKQLLDPFSLQPKASFVMGQSADGKASNAVAWANNSLANRKFDYEKSQANAPDKPPSGFRWNTSGTSLEPIPGGPAAQEKPMTDTQAKAFDFGGRMLQASKTIEALSKDGVNRAIPGQNSGFGVGTVMNATVVPADWQKLEQSKRQWINAALRRESGAVIGTEEMVNFDKTYFPQIGEGADVIKQKAEARRQVESGILADVPTPHLKKLGVFGNSGGWEDAYKKYGG